MSAPPIRPLASSTSASGFEDGFGRRALAFDREDGTMLERLYLRPEFSIYEGALRDAFAHLAAASDERIAAPRGLERDRVTGELVAVFPFVTGERLSDLLDAASEHARDEGAVPGIEVALGFLLEVLPALETLRATTGMSHGAVTPSRCVLTSAGRVVLTECGFAAILQRLNLNRQRLWREFRVAMPPVAGGARFDATGDISQAALAAVMLVLGRPMGDDDAADVLPELMAEAIEIAQIRSNVTFAINLQRLLQRALPLPGRRPYQTVDAALHDVHQLASSIGVDLCQSSLADFVRHVDSAPAAYGVAAIVEDDRRDTVVRAAAKTPFPAPVEAAPPTEFTWDAPAPEPVGWSAPESVGAPAEVPVLEAEVPVPQFEAPVPEFEAPVPQFEAPLPQFEAPVAQFEAPAPQFDLEPAFVPKAVSDPFTWRPTEAIAAPAEIPRTEFAVTPSEPPPVEAPAPAPVQQSRAARRRSRAKRKDDDTLRSSVAPVLVPEPTPPPAPTPLMATALEVDARFPAPAPIPVPVFQQTIPVPPPPVVPQPVFVPLQTGTELLWEPPKAIAPRAPAVPALQPIALAPPTRTALRLKNEAPAGFAAREPRHEPRDFSAAHVGSRPPVHGATREMSWKFAAAAAVVMIAVVAAARTYLPDADSVKAETKGKSAPVTVAAPPPVTTGTIVVQTQPAGARVLLDGSPAGETPLRIVDVAPGRHVLTFITSSSTVKRSVKVEADKTLNLDIPVFSGWVAIFAPIVLEVSEEGRTLGTTESGRLMLPPGHHTLTLTNREFGYSASHAVDVEAGEVRSLNIQPAGAVNLNAVPWAEVWIDGKKAGETPLANLELPLGNREIIFRHPEFGERRMMTRVAAGAPTAVSVDFTK